MGAVLAARFPGPAGIHAVLQRSVSDPLGDCRAPTLQLPLSPSMKVFIEVPEYSQNSSFSSNPTVTPTVLDIRNITMEFVIFPLSPGVVEVFLLFEVGNILLESRLPS